jgi:hypothetical protein
MSSDVGRAAPQHSRSKQLAPARNISKFACCIGLPLLIATGLGVAALALIGGLTVLSIALAAAIVLLVLRAHERRPRVSATIIDTRAEVIVETSDCRAPARGGPPATEKARTSRGGPLVEVLYFEGC